MATTSVALRAVGRNHGGGVAGPKKGPLKSAAVGSQMPRVPGDKPYGEFVELTTHYDGSYRPARMGLQGALETGLMRNPLQMQQQRHGPMWNRPKSAGAAGSSRAGMAKARLAELAARGALGAGGAQQHSARASQLQQNVAPSGTFVAQESEHGPGMLWPQRIELPIFLNTPARRSDREPLKPEDRTQILQRIQDLELLTYACRRANKLREEGRAHFATGVLRDNLRQYSKAIQSYTLFLNICQQCSDNQGCALAYHCIGVDHQLLGSGLLSGDKPSAEPKKDDEARSEVKPDALRKAIVFHNKHRENSDGVGRFIAHLNMGLAYASLGEKQMATVNHQYALRFALQLRSLEGQSLAIGSLSFSSGMYDNDPEKMRALIERYVELCGALGQSRNQATALRKLGTMAGEEGRSDESIRYFQRAIERAREQGDLGVEKDCSVQLGIAAGQARMAEHLNGILERSSLQGFG